MRAKRLAALLVAAVAAGAIAGCGDDDDERPVITGSGYQFEAPAGWEVVSPQAFKDLAGGESGLTPTQQRTLIDSAAADVDDGSNVSVTLQPGMPFPRRVNAAAAAELRKIYDAPAVLEQFLPEGATLAGDPVVRPSELAGTAMLEATLETTGTREAGLVQLIGPHAGRGYTITFTGPDPEAATADLAEVAATWRWQ